MTTIASRNQPRAEGDLKYGIIETTTRCQLRCPGCFMLERGKLGTNALTLEEAVRVLDLCRDFCGRELETMDILGGEPLLWPYLNAYIKELLRRGIKPWIFTNMLDITPAQALWLYERQIWITGKLNIGDPLDKVQLQLQADLIGSNVPTTRRMIDAIEVFRTAGYRAPFFRLENLLRLANLHLVPEFIRYCHSLNVGIDLEVMGCSEGWGPKYWQIAPTPQQLAEMIRELERQGIRWQLWLEANEKSGKVYPEFDQPADKLLMPHVFSACRFYDSGMYFAADGTIRACSNSGQTLAHVTDPEPIRRAWESPLVVCLPSRTSVSLAGRAIAGRSAAAAVALR